ncbi:hypothetical protein [Mesorhizobium sp. M00.F.Ca.ET.216.01.1.1]|uniref:hypothetical protein n=1 Tax=Mesorhizobium sp. M00.F.Ca.ET.216.01.1.1 TaxID=2500528 RepID=UPI000FDCD962|nr:hypothetical protein [Mesorhizobium sp. M00.F.Ca.ET.216.01.1.1]TGQ38333.1 hypothetical protein EN859_017805 [Mesorhizobium sp. M00.F.Ca.ET.216.01.1.1]
MLRQLMVALLRKNGVDDAKVRFVNIGAGVDVLRATVMEASMPEPASWRSSTSRASRQALAEQIF